MLARYPQLTTPGSLQTFMSSTFGPVDGDSIVLSMKSPKKKVIAAVPFKTISDAHAAVCASRRGDRGLDEFEITWMIGSEPAVWSWAERMLKSKEKEKAQRGATTTTTTVPAGGARSAGNDAPTVFPANIGNNARRGLPQDSGAQSSPATGPQFSSFPSSFVRSHTLALLIIADSPDHSETAWPFSSSLVYTSVFRSRPRFRVSRADEDATSRTGAFRA
jgi:hypothetical protein